MRIRGDIAIPGVALLTRHSTAAIGRVGAGGMKRGLCVAVATLQSCNLAINPLTGLGHTRCAPGWELPQNAGEAA